ncbi:MAG: tetratricopeptide repeat protein [Promethearchaeota archaeon]|nr:MAG: tetratricopeptide repeat protein [Candidatus Lokiarchaeota archaeon]
MSHEEITTAIQRYNDLLNEARKYAENEQYNIAFETVERAEREINRFASKSESGNIAYQKGKLLTKMGRYKKAEEYLKTALSISKETKGAIDDSRITFSLGNLYYYQSDIEMALRYYLNALSIINDEFERTTYTRSHLTDQIIQEQVKQHLRLSEIYFELDDLDKSLKHGRLAIELGEKTKDQITILNIQHKLAKIEIKLGKHKKAFNHLIDIKEQILNERGYKTKVLKIDIYNSLTELCIKLGNTDDAKEYIRKIYPLVKDSKSKLINYYYNLGKIYIETGGYKYAINNFSKAIELSESSKSPLLSKILFEIGNIYYNWKKYTRAIETLKKCIHIVEKQKNFKLEARINLLIGKIIYFKENFKDAKYYFNQAYNLSYNKINDFKGCIIAKNYLARIYYFQGNMTSALEEFKVSYKILNQIQCRNNIEISDETLNKLAFIVIINIIKIKIKLYEENQDVRYMIEMLGYLEFLKFFRSRDFFKITSKISSPLSSKWKKISSKLADIKKEITILDSKFKDSIYNDEKEKIEKSRNNKIENYLSLSDKIWDKSIDGIKSFPIEVSKIPNRFFNIMEDQDKNWLILYILYSPIDEKLIVFTIDPIKRNINYYFKYHDYSNIKKLIKSQIEINKSKVNNSSKMNLLIEDISSQLFDLFPDQVKNIITSNKYKNLTIIPHSFLFDLPWELTKVKNMHLYLKCNISRHYSLDWLRIDIEKDLNRGSRKDSIFYIINPDHGTDLELPYSENEILSLKNKFSGTFKSFELNYIEATLENYVKALKKRKFSILHHGGSLIITDNPKESKMKLFRHDYITLNDQLKYVFKINPIIIISNIKHQNELNKTNDILYFLRSFMVSGASGFIFSPTSGRKTDKSNFYLDLYDSLEKNDFTLKAVSKALRNLDNSNLPIRHKYWIFIGDPFYKL